MKISYNEFHISKSVRKACNFDESLFSSCGNVIFANFKAVQDFQIKLNLLFDERGQSEKRVSAGSINAMGLIDEIFHYVCMLFRRNKSAHAFKNILEDLNTYFSKEEITDLLLEFMEEFPPVAVYKGELTAQEYLQQDCFDEGTKLMRSNREQVLEEMILLHLANENPAFHPFQILFDDSKLAKNPLYIRTWNQIKAFFKTQPVFGPKNNDLITMLKEPVEISPTSLKGQLDYIRQYWADFLGDWLLKLLAGIDTLTEEEKAFWHPVNGGEVSMDAYSYDSDLMKEYERFSPDKDWMPKVVLMAKTVLVWLYQLSKKYNREITRLDQIPDEELDALKAEGFTGLWLIGLWERSSASRRIKQICGNPEAAASAYSLFDYEIAWNLGGWSALENLRKRCWIRGIRLGSDMVPNHTGMDGKWVVEHPDYFITTKENPFPQYTYNGENLSQDSRVGIYLEDHYYSKTDCAVCFKRVDFQTGDVTYIYHGNDGTGMPWNDTAQIDFLNPVAREAVMQEILKVASNFPIIRFDAAMVLAKKHIRRLWYPEPGHGGDIATRSRYAMSPADFENRIPNEFWREVVDRCAQEKPDTLLLAEAFWMMEGYFTRTLGMHRVYNSAFMNMLKKEENQKYRDTVKNTIKFDPQILKRFVNFMNNPDEETAVAQFGKGDKYFGVCTLMVTMPGLPMFGHGQLEGFEEKYGMEYTRAYKDEKVDEGLYNRHCHDIFPLMHKRYLFSGVDNFLFYDVWNNGTVNENIFAYSNGTDQEKTIVFYNNKYERAAGWIKRSCEYAVKTGTGEKDVQMKTRTLGEGLGLTSGSKNFCIFKEHRSGLWYVRRSDDLINQGMFVSLNGFEYQVYVEVQQVTDTEDKKYETLCRILDGNGVTNLDVAWQEYQYKELYALLEKFASKEYFEKMHILLTPSSVLKAEGISPVKPEDIYTELKDAALAYYEKEAETAQKEYEDSSEGKEKLSATKGGRVTLSAIQATAEKRYTLFCRQIDYLYEVMQSALGEVKDGSDSTLKLSSSNTIYEGLSRYENAVDVLSGFALVSSAGSSNCIKWGFPRKLTQFLAKADIRSSSLEKQFVRLFVCMRIRDFNFGTSGIVKSTYEVALLLADSKYAALLTGANEYNGIKWFNKELMENTLWLALASVVMNSPRILKEQIFRLYRTLTAAKESSEYKCEKFIEAVKPLAKKSRPKCAKTSSSAKTDSVREKALAKKSTAKKSSVKKETAAKKTEAEKTSTKKTVKKSVKK